MCVNGAEVTGLLDGDGRAGGVACRDAEIRRAVRGRGRQRDQRDRRLGRPDPARGDPRRGRGAADRAQPRHPRRPSRSSELPLGAAACIVPAGEERTIFALPWYGRALIGTTDNDYDGDIAHVQPAADDIDYLLDAVNAFFGLDLGPRRPDRRLRRRAAADLDRRPAQVGRHLAQGRALRDLVGDADDHRRQADHLAADGEAGRRPDGRARGPGGALPHRRHPARDGGLRARARPARGPRRGRPAGGLPRAARLPLRPRGPQRAPARRRAARAGARRSSPGSPTCSPRRRSPPGSSRRARSPTCSCAAPGSACSPRPQLRTAESVRPVAEAMGAELGWDEARVRAEAERWVADAAAEGIDPARHLSRWRRALACRRLGTGLSRDFLSSAADGRRAQRPAPRRPARARRRGRDRRLPQAQPRRADRGARDACPGGPARPCRARPTPTRSTRSRSRRRRSTTPSEEPVELGPMGAEGGDERDDATPTEDGPRGARADPPALRLPAPRRPRPERRRRLHLRRPGAPLRAAPRRRGRRTGARAAPGRAPPRARPRRHRSTARSR